MNIALISREYTPFFGGGIGSYTVRFAQALAGAGHRPFVITVSENGSEHREEHDAITVIRLPFLDGQNWTSPHPAIATPANLAAFHSFHPVSVFAMQIAAAAPRLAHELKLDVIEAPDTGALAWFLLNARRTGAPEAAGLPPIVTTVHSPTAWIAHWNRSPLSGRAEHELSWMERDQARWSDALVCPSHALADWAAEHWNIDRSRITVIPYALGELEEVARAHTTSSSASRAPGASRPRRIVFSGRLEPRKGIDTLLEAFALSGARFELDLIGQDMPDRLGRLFGAAAIGRHIPANLRPRLHVRGKIDPAAIPLLLEPADFAAVPAPMDNFPFTCIEAMAHGKPIIAAAAGGMAEMIRDGIDGLLFTPGDAASCADALRRAAAMPETEIQAMSASAADRIRDLCGNQRIARARADHFESVIANALARRAPPTAPREITLVNANKVPLQSLDRLAGSLRSNPDLDFAHAWTTHDHVRAFSTPTLDSLALAPRALGPLALSRRAADDRRIAHLLQRAPDGTIGAESTWAIAATLAASGYQGTVIPDLLIEASAPSADNPGARVIPAIQDPSAREGLAQLQELQALRFELKQIKSSRGWRLLSFAYDLLHILRGRGLSRPRVPLSIPKTPIPRPYHPPEESGASSPPRGRNQIA